MELLKNNQLQVLSFVHKYGRSNGRKEAELKLHFANRLGDITAIANELVNENYLDLNNKNYTVSEKGKKFLDEFNSIGNAFLFEGYYDLAIMNFLYKIEGLFPYEFFPKNILSAATSHGKSMSKDYDLENYLSFHSPLKHYYFGNGRNIMLTTDGKSYFENIIQKAENEKLKREEEKAKSNKEWELKIRNLELDNVEKIRNSDDYKSIKRQRNWLFIIAIVSIVITIYKLFL